MNRHEHYSSASREFLRKAREELSSGDVVQASEKGWGAAAEMVKAISEKRDWRHNAHPLLHNNIRALVDETGDNLFQVAGCIQLLRKLAACQVCAEFVANMEDANLPLVPEGGRPEPLAGWRHVAVPTSTKTGSLPRWSSLG